MNKQQLEDLKGLFNKKEQLESRLEYFNVDTALNFSESRCKFNVYNNNISKEKEVTIPKDIIKMLFFKEKNKILLELHDLNHQIYKIKVTL